MTHFADLAARALRRRPTASYPEPSRDDAVATIAGALARRTRRATWRSRLVRGGALLAAAAAVTLAASWLLRDSERASACPTGLQCATLEVAGNAPSVFEPGEHVRVDQQGSAQVSFQNGTRVALDPKSSLEYREGTGTRRFGLSHGAAHIHVTKLGPGERFVIETRDAEVEVKGTVFDVFAADRAECGELTRVAVREGVVEVRAHGRTFRVPAGSSWPRACGAREVTATAPASTTPARGAEPREPASAHAHHTPRALAQDAPRAAELEQTEPAQERAAASDLAEQNRMFGVAMKARQAGKLSSALASYEEFLAKYPRSPLAESARVERIRILAKLDPTRAKGLAARYLVDYPNGFARAEARVIAEP